jgi:hypothetical protein
MMSWIVSFFSCDVARQYLISFRLKEFTEYIVGAPSLKEIFRNSDQQYREPALGT